jgi:transposase
VHLAYDGWGRPLSVVVTPGQRHESTQQGTVFDASRVGRPGFGRTRQGPEHLIADKGYSYPSCRGLLRRRGIPQTIPERRDQREQCAGRSGRPPGLDPGPIDGAMWWSGVSTGSSGGAGSPRDRHQVREAGAQLPGDARHRRVGDLVALVTSWITRLRPLGYENLANCDDSWNEWGTREDLPAE